MTASAPPWPASLPCEWVCRWAGAGHPWVPRDRGPVSRVLAPGGREGGVIGTGAVIGAPRQGGAGRALPAQGRHGWQPQDTRTATKCPWCVPCCPRSQDTPPSPRPADVPLDVPRARLLCPHVPQPWRCQVRQWWGTQETSGCWVPRGHRAASSPPVPCAHFVPAVPMFQLPLHRWDPAGCLLHAR